MDSSLNIRSSCGKAWQNENFRCKVICTTAFVALACITTYLLSQFNMIPMSDNLRWTILGSSAALTMIFFILNLYKPERYLKEIFKNLGYPQVTICRSTSIRKSLVDGEKHKYFEIKVYYPDSEDPIEAGHSSDDLNATWPNDETFKNRLEYNLMNRLYKIELSMADLPKLTLDNSNSTRAFWQAVQNNIARAIEKINASYRIEIKLQAALDGSNTYLVPLYIVRESGNEIMKDKVAILQDTQSTIICLMYSICLELHITQKERQQSL